MIVRSWSASASADGADAYEEHFRRRVLPQLERLEGFRGAWVLRQLTTANQVLLQDLTYWSSWDAIRSFAGEDVHLAVVEEAARAVLLTHDEHVIHYEIAVNGSPWPQAATLR